MSRLHVVWLVGCLSALVFGCSNGPTTPSSRLLLQDGRYSLTLIGFAISTDPLLPPCVPLGIPRDGTAVSTFVTLIHDSSELVARSTSSDLGDIELRFHETGTTPAGIVGVAGTIRGTAVDTVMMTSVLPRDVRASFGAGGADTARVQGETSSPVSSLISGRVEGAIRFSDRNGNASSCPAVSMTLQR